jgi:AcrR family transcriptional regulator
MTRNDVTKRPGKKRLGRRIGSSGKSRATILKAARALFAKQGFRGATTRAIAQRARVNVGLVNYFFESKAKLFAEATDLPVSGERLRELFNDGGGPTGSRIARFYLEHLFLDRNEAITAMLRAALGDPGCVPALRALIQDTLVAGVAGALVGADTKLRAELVGAQMVGLFISRHVVSVEPLASASIDAIVGLLGPALDSLLGEFRRASSDPNRVQKVW